LRDRRRSAAQRTELGRALRDESKARRIELGTLIRADDVAERLESPSEQVFAETVALPEFQESWPRSAAARGPVADVQQQDVPAIHGKLTCGPRSGGAGTDDDHVMHARRRAS
jgi:hypothetical protein